MTDEEKRKRFEIVKQCHDELKEHIEFVKSINV